MLLLFILFIAVAALVAAPVWPYSRGWGYYPSGGLGFVLLLLVAMLLVWPAYRTW